MQIEVCLDESMPKSLSSIPTKGSYFRPMGRHDSSFFSFVATSCRYNCTVFPRIVVHASIYETEAMVHAPKVSPKCTQKNRAVSYISACHCRDPKISYQFGSIKWPILSLKNAFLGGFKYFKSN